MHDIDRTLSEYQPEFEAPGADEFEFEFEFEEGQSEFEDSESGVLDETEEMELAAELLSVSDEAELDQFLGGLFKKIGRRVGKFVKSPIGRKLGGFLKSAAKKALPIVGGAVGTAFGGPVGAALGKNAGAAAGQIFGLELEGLSHEDQEFETARRFVRFAGEAAKNATQTSAAADPQMAAKAATIAAAKKFAPGLLRPAGGRNGGGMMDAGGGGSGGSGRSGRWLRRGRKIVLMGV
jgi:hypothetical protein